MSKTHLFLSEEDTRWQTALPNANELADRVVSAVFKDVLAHEDLDFLDGQKPVIIGLNLSNDGKVQELNRDYRGLDKPTNVLSFANLDDPDFYNDLALYEEVELGDIIIALETLEREADIKGKAGRKKGHSEENDCKEKAHGDLEDATDQTHHAPKNPTGEQRAQLSRRLPEGAR